jgi:phosphoglycolate phosphatase
LPTLKGLVLDLDGTLVDSLPDLVAVLNQVLGDFGVPALTAAEARPMVGDGTLRLVERALAARGVTPDQITPAQSRFLALYEARPARLSRPYAGVPEILAQLSAAGWLCALCTNKPERATRVMLSELDLDRFFRAIITGDSLPQKKPDPAPMRAALAALEVPPYCAVAVGDHANDLRAAAGAGLRAIFARYGYGTLTPDLPRPTAVIGAFAELPEKLARLDLG